MSSVQTLVFKGATASKTLSITLPREACAIPPHVLHLHEITAFETGNLIRYQALGSRLHDFEVGEYADYRYRFAEQEELGRIMHEHHNVLLAKPVWHVQSSTLCARESTVLWLPGLHRAKMMLTELDCLLRFVHSKGLCEGCTADNVRCKARPKREGLCLMHVYQAGKCMAIDEHSQHRCIEKRGLHSEFCTVHEVRIGGLLQQAKETVEVQIEKVKAAHMLLEDIMRSHRRSDHGSEEYVKGWEGI